MTEWHQLQYWLADGERRVEIPFATDARRLIPPIAVRLRRDFGSLLGLVRAHALLHRADPSTMTSTAGSSRRSRTTRRCASWSTT